MIRIIVFILLALAIFWGYNNFDFGQFVDNAKASLQNEKTVKAVNSKRALDYEQEQNAMSEEALYDNEN